MLFTDSEWWKAIPVAKLRELLAQVPQDAWVSCTPVGNLGILAKEGESEFGMLGVIEIDSETYDTYQDIPEGEDVET
jgi:hypothetical protein